MYVIKPMLSYDMAALVCNYICAAAVAFLPPFLSVPVFGLGETLPALPGVQLPLLSCVPGSSLLCVCMWRSSLPVHEDRQ